MIKTIKKNKENERTVYKCLVDDRKSAIFIFSLKIDQQTGFARVFVNAVFISAIINECFLNRRSVSGSRAVIIL